MFSTFPHGFTLGRAWAMIFFVTAPVRAQDDVVVVQCCVCDVSYFFAQEAIEVAG